MTFRFLRPWLMSLLIGMWVSTGRAQPFLLSDSVVVTLDGQTLANPWAGGLNSAQFGKVDMDLDGVEDLVVLERTANLAQVFLARDGRYVHAPELGYLLPELRVWFALVDYDCDGDKDLFGYYRQQIGIWENEPRDGLVRFRLVREKLRSQFGNVAADLKVSTVDFPVVKDIDGDGDVDILKPNQSFSDRLELHLHRGVEEVGLCDSMIFERVSARWGNLLECATCGTFIYSDTVVCPARLEHIGGSALLLSDFDGDGALDLLFREEGCETTYLFANRGGSVDAALDSVVAFPPTAALPRQIYSVAFEEDVTFDGEADLIFSPLAFFPSDSVDFAKTVRLMEKNGGGASGYGLSTEAFLQEGMIDLGHRAYPAFADYDGDGDMDLLVGNGQQMQMADGQRVGTVALFENTGTNADPSYDWVTTDWLEISRLRLSYINLQMVDLDGDGQVDLTFSALSVDDFSAKLYYVLGKGGGAPAWDLAEIQTVDIPSSALDDYFFFDADLDGDLDVLRGRNATGEILLYTNGGGLDFSLDRTFEETGFDFDRYYVNLWVDDLDEDGLADLLFVGFDGRLVLVYDFLNDWQASDLVINTTVLDGDLVSRFGRDAAFAVFEDQMVVGQNGGGLLRLVNQSARPPSVREGSLLVFPSPASEEVRFRSGAVGEVRVYDALGRRLASFSLGADVAVALDVRGWAAGTYVAVWTGGQGATAEKFVILR